MWNTYVYSLVADWYGQRSFKPWDQVRFLAGEQNDMNDDEAIYRPGVWSPKGPMLESMTSIRMREDLDNNPDLTEDERVEALAVFKALRGPEWTPNPSMITSKGEMEASISVMKELEGYFMGAKEHKKKGPGLFEFMEEGTQIAYSPGATTEVPYELSAEEHEMFDNSPGTREEIEEAKSVYKGLKDPTQKSGIDEIVKAMQEIWFDKVPKPEREIVIGTNQAGLELFDKALIF